MVMSDVNWDLAPKGTVGIARRQNQLAYINGNGDVHLDGHWGISANWETVIARPQERKTIQDVLEAYPDGWPERLPHPKCEGFCFISQREVVWASREEDGVITTYVVCTREEYEEARGEKVEEWTHTCVGLKCKIIINKPDREGYIVIVNELGEYYVVIEDDELKPIKPQISKAKAWDMLNEKASTVNEFRNALVELQDKYEVVDESSEAKS